MSPPVIIEGTRQCWKQRRHLRSAGLPTRLQFKVGEMCPGFDQIMRGWLEGLNMSYPAPQEYRNVEF